MAHVYAFLKWLTGRGLDLFDVKAKDLRTYQTSMSSLLAECDDAPLRG